MYPGGAPPSGPPLGAPPPMMPVPKVTPPPEDLLPQMALSEEEVQKWWARVDLDRQRRKRESDRWRKLFKGYMPTYQSNADYDDVNSNIHFRNAHLKIAEVWAQLPELILTPREPLREPILDPQTQQPLSPDHLVAIKREVLNTQLGRDGANVDLTILEALFDIFATTGIGATKICYEADVVPVPDEPPAQMPGSILGLSQPAPPVPVVVNERTRWYRFSANKLLIPHGWTSTAYDEAPYLAMEFAEPLTPMARKKHRLPPDFQATASRDELLIDAGERDPGPGTLELLKGVEIWLHAADFDPGQPNRDVFYRLVLIEGMKERAASYTQSPYQTIGDDGRLTADSMIGNPIHPITLRVASDQAWIPPDAAFTDPLVRIENTWMRQDTQLRDANIPRFVADVQLKVALDKLREAGVGGGAYVDTNVMSQGKERLLVQLPFLERAQSDATGREHLQRAIQETLGISPNQAGGFSSTIRSATEVATVQANVSVRLKGEQNILLARVLQGVRKFDSLLQRYMTEPGYVAILGATGARHLVAYDNSHLQGRYAYDAHPDSQLTIDETSRIKKYTDFTNFEAKNPYLSLAENLRVGCNVFGYDPSRMMKQPDPPPPPPISLALNLAAPNLAENLLLPDVRQILISHGIQIAPVAGPEVAALAQVQAARTAAQPHGGGVAKADLVDKHHSDETGKQVGTPPLAGGQAPAVVPGHMLQ